MLRGLNWTNIIAVIVLLSAGVLSFWNWEQAMVFAVVGLGLAVLGRNF